MLSDIVPVIVITVVSGFIHGLSGFGSVLVALPLLSLFFDIRLIVPLVTIQALCINFTLFTKLRKNVKKNVLYIFLFSAFPGILTGITVFRKLPEGVLKIILGTIIFSFSSYLLWNRSFKKDLNHIWTVAAGFAAGILGGSIGANGPPIIIYTAVSNWTKDQVKSTITSFLFIAGVFTVSLFIYHGFVTQKVLTLFAFSLPSLITGMICGNFAYRFMDDRNYDTAIKMLLLFLGAGSIVAGL